MKTFTIRRFFIDDPSGSYDMYEVTCPHCKRPFWVRLIWKKSSDYFTRACPYCWKTSKLPEPGEYPKPKNPKKRSAQP